MKKRTLTTVILLVGFFTVNIVNGQSRTVKNTRKIIKIESEAFQKFVDDPKKLGKSIRSTYGVAYEKGFNIKKGFCTSEDYKLPKKVALLSFYVQDEDYSVYSKYLVTTYKASKGKVNAIAQRLYDQSIDKMKSNFLEKGMELVTPDEFLTNDKLKNIYYNAPLPNLEGKAGVFKVAGDGAAVPDGFRLIPYPSITISGNKFHKERSTFFEALDMDAYVIVVVRMSAAEGTISGVTSHIFYKNPGYPAALKQKEKDGKVIPYGAYGGIVGKGEVILKLEPHLKGIYIKKEEPYVNKRGKDDIKFVKTDMNPNISVLISAVMKQTAENTVNQILKPVKNKKKKK